jgi:hypothetical protein
MLMYEPKARSAVDTTGADSGSAMCQYLADSARDIKSRQQTAPSAASVEADRERAAAERRRAAEDRAIRKRVRAEWRATLTPRERLVENLHSLKRLRLVWLLVSVSLAAAAIAAATLAKAPTAVGVGGAVYILALLLGGKIIHRRARKLPADHVERVHEQLDRVKSTLHTA